MTAPAVLLTSAAPTAKATAWTPLLALSIGLLLVAGLFRLRDTSSDAVVVMGAGAPRGCARARSRATLPTRCSLPCRCRGWPDGCCGWPSSPPRAVPVWLAVTLLLPGDDRVDSHRWLALTACRGRGGDLAPRRARRDPRGGGPCRWCGPPPQILGGRRGPVGDVADLWVTAPLAGGWRRRRPRRPRDGTGERLAPAGRRVAATPRRHRRPVVAALARVEARRLLRSPAVLGRPRPHRRLRLPLDAASPRTGPARATPSRPSWSGPRSPRISFAVAGSFHRERSGPTEDVPGHRDRSRTLGGCSGPSCAGRGGHGAVARGCGSGPLVRRLRPGRRAGAHPAGALLLGRDPPAVLPLAAGRGGRGGSRATARAARHLDAGALRRLVPVRDRVVGLPVARRHAVLDHPGPAGQPRHRTEHRRPPRLPRALAARRPRGVPGPLGAAARLGAARCRPRPVAARARRRSSSRRPPARSSAPRCCHRCRPGRRRRGPAAGGDPDEPAGGRRPGADVRRHGLHGGVRRRRRLRTAPDPWPLRSPSRPTPCRWSSTAISRPTTWCRSRTCSGIPTSRCSR